MWTETNTSMSLSFSFCQMMKVENHVFTCGLLLATRPHTCCCFSVRLWLHSGCFSLIWMKSSQAEILFHHWTLITTLAQLVSSRCCWASAVSGLTHIWDLKESVLITLCSSSLVPSQRRRLLSVNEVVLSAFWSFLQKLKSLARCSDDSREN